MPSQCAFCRIAAGEMPAQIVLSTPNIVAFHDIRAQAPTHILIVPRKHIERLSDLQDEDRVLLGEMMLAVRDVAAKVGVSSGFRIVANNGESAGQSIFHIHFHLLAGRRMSWPPG